VTIAGSACERKALFVTRGDDIAIDNICFVGANVPDRNGAGIGAEGRNLEVKNSCFFDNEDGLLAGASPNSVITITNSAFIGNGAMVEGIAHGV
jgi:hypothetical protein